MLGCKQRHPYVDWRIRDFWSFWLSYTTEVSCVSVSNKKEWMEISRNNISQSRPLRALNELLVLARGKHPCTWTWFYIQTSWRKKHGFGSSRSVGLAIHFFVLVCLFVCLFVCFLVSIYSCVSFFPCFSVQIFLYMCNLFLSTGLGLGNEAQWHNQRWDGFASSRTRWDHERKCMEFLCTLLPSSLSQGHSWKKVWGFGWNFLQKLLNYSTDTSLGMIY